MPHVTVAKTTRKFDVANLVFVASYFYSCNVTESQLATAKCTFTAAM